MGLQPNLECVTTLVNMVADLAEDAGLGGGEGKRGKGKRNRKGASERDTRPSGGGAGGGGREMAAAKGASNSVPPPPGSAASAKDIAEAYRSISKSKSPVVASVGGSKMTSAEALERAFNGLALLEARNERPDVYMLNALMRACVAAGEYSRAHDIFWRVMRAGGASEKEKAARPCAPDAVSWNIVLDSYARQGRPGMARSAFDEMLQQSDETGIAPDQYTYTEVIKSLLNVDDFATAEYFLERMEETAARMAEQRKRVAQADRLRELRGEDEDDDEGSLEKDMLRDLMNSVDLRPDVVVYNVFVKALSRSLRWREAEDMVRRMTDKGIRPDWETYSYLVPCLVRAQQPALAVEKLDEMRAANIRPNVIMYTSFITAQAKLGDAIAAFRLLNEMKADGLTPNVKTLTAVMQGCIQAGNADLALAMCGEMKKGGLELDGVVYTMIVQALALKGEVRRAALLVASVQRDYAEGVSSTQIIKSTYNMLLKVAVESGSWAIAVGALSEILLNFSPNDATYAALITPPVEEDVAGPGPALGMEAGAGSGGSTTYQPDLGDYDDSGEGYDEYGDAGERREGA